ncbi:MAG: cytochrome c oxidase assembly protein [Acidobacteriia bacterium]|nr:cytochrome c oxidase assembly protein [Terriglobia bacterium]
MSPAALAVLASWSFPPWVTALNLLTALLYVRGWSALRPVMPDRFGARRLVCFLSGLATLELALASPIDAFDPFFVADHMFQHMLLMMLVPPLILLGEPAIPLLHGLPRWVARDVLGPFLSSPALQRLGGMLTHPAFGWLALALAMLGWHVPKAYELALHSSGWHEAEHATFLVASLLFWWPVCQPWPSRARWPAWALPIYLLLADFVNTALSAFLTFSDRVLYPSYSAVPRLTGISAQSDQVVAGVSMWVVGSIAFLVPAVAITVRLLSPSRPALEVRKESAPIETGSRRAVLAILMLALPVAALAYGWLAPEKIDIDEAVVRTQSVAGPFKVSVFAPQDPVPAGPSDISVLVQDAHSDETILDAEVDLSVQPVNGAGSPGVVRATHEESANKLLQAGTIDLPSSGAWELRASVRREGDQGQVTANLETVPRAPESAPVWPYAVAVAIIILIALHRLLKIRALQRNAPVSEPF